MFVEELRNDTRGRIEWESFLRTAPERTFYHSLKWKEVIEKTFSQPTAYFVIRNNNRRLIGIFPVVISKLGPLRIYDSLPYSDLGGPIIEKSHIREASLSLQRFLEKSGYENGISGAKVCFIENGLGQLFKSERSYVDRGKGIVEIDLERKPPDFIWKKELRKRHRKRIRRFARDGFQIREAKQKLDLRRFLIIYYRNMKHIGAPSYPPAFFENIWSTLYPENFNILLCEKDKTVGGIAFFKYGQRIYLAYSGFRRELLLSRYQIMPYLYWRSIRWAEENKFTYVCFGGTPSYPKSVNYSQKIMFGASFLQQETVSVPFDLSTFAFLIAKKKLYAFTKTLPLDYKRRVKNIFRILEC